MVQFRLEGKSLQPSYCAASVGRVKPVGPSNVLSMAQLRTLPLVDQVKTLMKNGSYTLDGCCGAVPPLTVSPAGLPLLCSQGDPVC